MYNPPSRKNWESYYCNKNMSPKLALEEVDLYIPYEDDFRLAYNLGYQAGADGKADCPYGTTSFSEITKGNFWYTGLDDYGAGINLIDYDRIDIIVDEYEPVVGDLVYHLASGKIEFAIDKDTDLIQMEFYPLIENFGCVVLRRKKNAIVQRVKNLLSKMQRVAAWPNIL